MKTIPLTQGKQAIVDDEDYEMVAKYKWYTVHAYRSLWYAAHSFPHPLSKYGCENIYLHRFITQAPDGLTVDHINGNGLDNRRSNLRICTLAENLANQHRTTRKARREI